LNNQAVPAFYVLAILGACGIHIRQAPARPNIAWAGFVLMLLGLVVGTSSVPLSIHGGGLPNSDLGLLQAIGLWMGSAAFGSAILAAGVMPRPVALAFLFGATLAFIGPAMGESLRDSSILTALSRVGIAIYAFGWIVAGISLQTRGDYAAVADDPILGRLRSGLA
jgi:hypothetical protein